jgi:hypothetical protein
MSLVKPCTSTAVWPWYKVSAPAELARRAKSCYGIRAFYSGPGGDTMTAGGAGNPSAEATLKQPSEEMSG